MLLVLGISRTKFTDMKVFLFMLCISNVSVQHTSHYLQQNYK